MPHLILWVYNFNFNFVAFRDIAEKEPDHFLRSLVSIKVNMQYVKSIKLTRKWNWMVHLFLQLEYHIWFQNLFTSYSRMKNGLYHLTTRPWKFSVWQEYQIFLNLLQVILKRNPKIMLRQSFKNSMSFKRSN